MLTPRMFFQAEDGIRDDHCDWSSDVCSSDLTLVVSHNIVDMHKRKLFVLCVLLQKDRAAGIVRGSPAL